MKCKYCDNSARHKVEPLLGKPQYKIGEKIDIPVSRTNGEPNFDKACEQAYHMAIMRFGCDDCGHLNNVEGSERSCDSVVVEFKRYRHYGGMGGQTCEYVFEAWVERNEDDDDEG